MKSVNCTNGCLTTNLRIRENKNGSNEIIVKFSEDQCQHCPLNEQCLETPKAKLKTLKLSTKYDAVTKDIHRNNTEEFKKAADKRYIIERRFATLVRNNIFKALSLSNVEKCKNTYKSCQHCM